MESIGSKEKAIDRIMILADGEMGRLIRSHDWSTTPVGALARWPRSLLAITNVMLASPVAMVMLWGARGTLIYNDAYAEFAGRRHPGLLGMDVLEAWPEAAELNAEVMKAGLAGRTLSFKDRELVLNRNGSPAVCWIDLDYSPLFDDDGLPGGVIAIVRETTERIREQRRREALHRLTDLVRSAEDPVELGYGAARIVGMTLDAARVGLSRIDHDAETLLTERDWTADGVRPLEGRLTLRDYGSFVDGLKAGEFTVIADVRSDARTNSPAATAALEAYDTRAFVNVPILEQGRLVAVFFVNSGHPRAWSREDLEFIREAAERTRTATERLRTDQARREAVLALESLNATLETQVAERTAERNLLATIVEETDAFVHVVDLDFRWLAINRAGAVEFERVFGTLPKVGDRMLDLLDDQPAERAAVEAIWSRALAGEEFTAVSEFGDPRHVAERHSYEMKFNALRDAEGRRIGAFQVVTDITDRVRAEAKQAQFQEALLQSQKMEAMGQLTGGVAHDFNNLLTPIIGALDMLQRRLTLGAREARLVDGALQSADRAKTLVQRLLAFARRQPLQSGAVDVPTLVSAMSEIVASTTGPRVVVRTDVPGGLPAALADANQLEMALLNLCVNARDAMPDGGAIDIRARAERPPPEVGVRRRDAAHIRLSVIDDGVGMDEETAKRAVEPFFSTKGIGKGTGLGLSMVHGLVSQLGGALTIETRPGAGTRIDLWLPISGEAAEPAQSTEAAKPETFKGRVLVVDDESFVRMTTADMLQSLGYETEEAEDAREAERRMLEGERFNLVVSDHLMPGMSGVELAKRIRERFPDVPVLIVSGYAEVVGISPDLPRLGKPFRQAELAEAIRKLVLH